jgi:hypothetical protein
MTDNLSDQELHALFRKHLPLRPMSPELAERLQQQVLAAVATTLQATARPEINAVQTEETLPHPFIADTRDDHELHTLFREHMPLKPMPPELAKRLQQQVLAAVATNLQTAPRPEAKAAPLPSKIASIPLVNNQRNQASKQLLRLPAVDWLHWDWSYWLTLLREKLHFTPALAMAGLVLMLMVMIGLFVPALIRSPMATPSPATQANGGTKALPPSAIARQAKVTITGGTAIIKKQSGEIETLVAGTTTQMSTGDRLQTGASTVHIQFFAGQSTTAEPGADVEIKEYTEQGDTTRIALLVHSGKTDHEVATTLASDDLFEVRTPAAVASLKHSKLTVEAL